jgi:hypothetical protein
MTPGKSRTRQAEGLRKSSSSADVLGGVPAEHHPGRDECADQAREGSGPAPSAAYEAPDGRFDQNRSMMPNSGPVGTRYLR